MSLPYSTLDLSALMGVSLPLQLDKVQYQATPLVDNDVGRFLTAVQIEGEGFIQAASQATFDAAVAALTTATDVSGTDLTITDLGGATLHRVLAAQCVEGGPHVGFTVLPDRSGVWYRRIRFKLDAKVVGPVTLSAYKLTVAAGPDGLARVTQQGVVGGPSAAATFDASVLAGFLSTYQAGGYAVGYRAEYPYAGDGGTAAALLVRYELRAEQLADPLPAGGGSAGIVDGTVTVRTDRDEQQRLVSSYEYDLTLNAAADHQSIVTQLRGLVSDPITRETVSYASVRQRRLRCAFNTLTSATNDGLLNFTQTLTIVSADDAYQEFSYPGADPIAIQLPDVYARVTQSGSAVGVGQFPQPPAPLLQHYDQQRPTTRFTDVSDYEKSTEWTYQFLDVEDGSGNGPDVESLVLSIGRSSVPGFYGDGGEEA